MGLQSQIRLSYFHLLFGKAFCVGTQTMERTIQTVLEFELSVYFNGQPERQNEIIQSVG